VTPTLYKPSKLSILLLGGGIFGAAIGTRISDILSDYVTLPEENFQLLSGILFACGLPLMLLFIGAVMVYYGFFSH